MASPVDGKVMACGEVNGDLIEHVKGKSYSLSAFLGSKVDLHNDGKEDESGNVKQTKLYHCVISSNPTLMLWCLLSLFDSILLYEIFDWI
jgi:phosphatidylserine decarboxylase